MRFKSNRNDILIGAEKLLTDAAVEPDVDLSALWLVCDTYGQDFDRARLQSQLELFYAEVKKHLASAGDITKQDPHVEEDDSQQCQKEAAVDAFFDFDAFFIKEYFRSVYGKVYHLIKIYRVITVSSASSERSFCTLRRAKTWLRSSMTEDPERLSDLSIMRLEST